MSQFTLSRDTDWSDLMQFISDNRETFDYSRKDLNTISKNECFGLVALQVKEYLEDEGLSLDDIDLSHYSNDKRKNALEDVVARAFRTYLSGEYNPAEVHEFVEEAKASCGIADRRPSLSELISAAEAGKGPGGGGAGTPPAPEREEQPLEDDPVLRVHEPPYPPVPRQVER